jgi:serine/threonine-protein kinase HipA
VTSQTLSYLPSFVQDPRAYPLSPDIPLVLGNLSPTVGNELFGPFSDSAPDGWGRRMLTRQRRLEAKASGRTYSKPTELDCLFGVHDYLRQGAIRFRDNGEFLAAEGTGVPKLVDLPQLLHASNELVKDPDAYTDEIRALFGAATSLGGARPKAAVTDESGQLCIAKFPSAGEDLWDVMAWEKVSLDIAAAAGMSVPASTLMNIGGKNVLVLERFDRKGDTRIGYISAMTALASRDGIQGCYLDLAEWIEEFSGAVESDLHELWARIALSIAIGNTDDHLRNHGFIRHGATWRLSPVFDINPTEGTQQKRLRTEIEYGDDRADFTLLLGASEYFQLDRPDAIRLMERTVDAASDWRKHALALAIPKHEMSLLGEAIDSQLSRRP